MVGLSLREIAQRILEETLDSKLTLSLIGKYHTMLWHARAFLPLPDQQNLPLKERQMMRAEDRRSFTAFVAHYEHTAVFKALQAEPALDAKGVFGLLGIEESDPDALAYARALLRQNGDFDADGLIVPDIGSGPDPLFVQRLTGLFSNPNEAHSRGQLLNQLRKIYRSAEEPFDYVSVGPLFDACVKHGVIREARDGVTRVYCLRQDC